MRWLVLFPLLLKLSYSIRQNRPLRVYPEPRFGLPTGVEPKPMRLWKSSSFASPQTRRTDRSPWMINRKSGREISCDGFLRYGSSGGIFSPPIMASVVNETCGLSELQNYLWKESSNFDSGRCKCLKPIPMTVAQSYQGSVRCFAAPSAMNGWPVPGLVDCEKYPDQVTSLVYHRESGQLRSNGNCLTASSFNASAPVYNAWTVQFAPCLGYVDPLNRQAWDVSEGVGEQMLYTKISDKLLNSSLGEPMGHVGRIVLRDSADIGKRCLDVAYDFPALPSVIPVVFLEAMLCSDSRFNVADFAVWRFYQAVSRTEAYGMNQWLNCNNAACADCSDGQLKVIFSSGNETDPVSVPYNYGFGQTCDVDFLRQMALPEALYSRNATCYCQPNALLAAAAKLSHLISPNADDLPSTLKPSFPAKNSTKSEGSF